MSFVDGYSAQGTYQTSEAGHGASAVGMVLVLWARCWCCTLSTTALWWWRQDHCCRLEASLVYTVSSCPVNATQEDHFRKLVGGH